MPIRWKFPCSREENRVRINQFPCLAMADRAEQGWLLCSPLKVVPNYKTRDRLLSCAPRHGWHQHRYTVVKKIVILFTLTFSIIDTTKKYLFVV